MSEEAGTGKPGATPGRGAPSPREDGSGHNQSEQSTNKKKKKKSPGAAGTYAPGFIGRSAQIKNHVYDVTPGRNGLDVFAKTTREIANHIASTVANAGEFRTAMDPDALAFSEITEPVGPADRDDLVAMEKWKVKYRKYDELISKREEATKRAYAIVWWQCSQAIQQQRVEAHDEYNTVSDDHDVMGLLGLIRTSMYTGATSKDKAHSLIDALSQLSAF